RLGPMHFITTQPIVYVDEKLLHSLLKQGFKFRQNVLRQLVRQYRSLKTLRSVRLHVMNDGISQVRNRSTEIFESLRSQNVGEQHRASCHSVMARSNWLDHTPIHHVPQYSLRIGRWIRAENQHTEVLSRTLFKIQLKRQAIRS